MNNYFQIKFFRSKNNLRLYLPFLTLKTHRKCVFLYFPAMLYKYNKWYC
jgi:hypothetical protein